MKDINSRNIITKRLELRIPTMKEQRRLWEILNLKEINQYYFPTPDRIFSNHNLSKYKIDDLIKARSIFLEQLSDWERQKFFYERKINNIISQEDSQKFTWSIFLKNTDTVIGQITCQEKDNEEKDVRDVGWYIDPEYQKNGYATEAANAMLEFMFNEVEIKEIKTSAAEINPASWTIMEKLGFQYIGDKKLTYYKDKEILTLKEYYLNKELFDNRKI